MKRLQSFCLLLIVFFLPELSIAATIATKIATHAAQNQSLVTVTLGKQKFEAVSGELVLRLKNNLRKQNNTQSILVFQKIAHDLQINLKIKSSVGIRLSKTDSSFAVFQMNEKALEDSIKSLNQDSRVAYAERNYWYHLLGTRTEAPNDTDFSKLWGLENTGQADSGGQIGIPGSDIRVRKVWDEGVIGSHSIKVAVIDTGIDYTHPDLVDNIWTNPGEIAGNGVDDDHNGFIDDIHGWNFAAQTNDPKDDHNHGSHCAGTIGAMANNAMGVTGINWKVSLIPVKFLTAQGGGSLENAVQATQYATHLGVNIMSNSWGGGPFTQALYDAIKEAQSKGILFVAAAGNDSSDNDAVPSYPASYQLDNIVSVAATDNQDKIASFSNFGKSTVHVAAPGVKILSTVKDGQYATFSGTSMAAPHVSGIAALLLSANPSMTYAQIKDTLMKSSDKVKVLSRRVVSKGRVNAYNALHGIYPADNTPDESLWKDVAYTAETPHPYENSKTYRYPFNVPGAKRVRVVFENIDTESGYDKISIQDLAGTEIESISGSYLQAYTTDYLEGESGQVIFKTDSTMTKNGFKIAKLQAIF